MAEPVAATTEWCTRARSLLGLSAGTANAIATAADPGDLARAAKGWNAAVEAVGRQLAQLGTALRATGDPRCLRIAEYGLSGLTQRESVGMRAALLECQANPAEPKHRARLVAAIAAWRKLLAENALVPLLERNPLGVACAIRQPLDAWLQALEAAAAG